MGEKFDFIAGTSTGSTIAASLAVGQDIGKCIELYRDFGPEIFPPVSAGKRERKWLDVFKMEPAYNEGPLANALQKLFGVAAKLSHAKVPLLIPTYDVLHRQIFSFKSYEAQMADIPIWEACKASCSAPTYFPAHVLTHEELQRPLIDGGVFSNNPSMHALSEVINMINGGGIRNFQRQNGVRMLSIGTGNLLRKISIEDSRKWGPIRWARPLIDVLLDSSSEAAHIYARHIITQQNYLRIQVDLSDVNDDLDDASMENIQALHDLAVSFCQGDAGGELIDRAAALISAD